MKRLFLFIALFATVWEMKAQSIGAPFRWETTLGLNVSDLGGLGSRDGMSIAEMNRDIQIIRICFYTSQNSMILRTAF